MRQLESVPVCQVNQRQSYVPNSEALSTWQKSVENPVRKSANKSVSKRGPLALIVILYIVAKFLLYFMT